MKGNYFGNGIYRKITSDSFWENPDAQKDYQNDLAISRGDVPKGMARIPKIRKPRTNSIKPPKSHLKRNLLMAGACLSLPFAAGFILAETGSGFDETYLSTLGDISDQHSSLIEMVEITEVTAETVHNEASSQLSEASNQNVSWIDPMPSNSRIGRPDYDNPSQYELNKIVLELG